MYDLTNLGTTFSFCTFCRRTKRNQIYRSYKKLEVVEHNGKIEEHTAHAHCKRASGQERVHAFRKKQQACCWVGDNRPRYTAERESAFVSRFIGLRVIFL
jgi:hypothetical protein